MKQKQNYKSFFEFYPFYLSEHKHRYNKLLHFLGTGSVIILGTYFVLTENLHLMYILPLFGYGFAWTGHFLIEKNRPATFKHPFYSLMGDFVMFFDILRGKVKI